MQDYGAIQGPVAGIIRFMREQGISSVDQAADWLWRLTGTTRRRPCSYINADEEVQWIGRTGEQDRLQLA
eukprot:1764704-Prorocentrum_lima.AAC.1